MESPPASEQSVISAIAEALGSGAGDPRVLVPSGDDAAVLRLEETFGAARRLNSSDLVLTTDLLVEGVHFDLRLGSLADAGYKALTVNLSDLAAMGAMPAWALGNLGLPRGASGELVSELISGVQAACELARAAAGRFELIGGDTVAAPQWILGFTLIGESRHNPLTRKGARPGDLIWHSGSLGLAQTGLHVLLGSLPARSKLKREDYPQSIAAQRRPMPQLALGNWLAREGLASACMDLSDSLSQCLLQLAQASSVGLDIDLGNYPLHEEVQAFLELHRVKGQAGFSLPARLDPRGETLSYESAAQYLLAAAEDYQLLFTAPPQSTQGLLSSAPVPLTRIGTVVDVGEGCTYRAGAGSRMLTASGWEHR